MSMNKDRRFTILMVEDDHDDRHITQSLFAEKGYNIQLKFLDETDKLITFLEDAAIEGDIPDLILLDLNLPRKSGYELLKELKTHSQFHIIPVVIVSGTAHSQEVRECYRLGANSFIQKPFTDQHTQEKIETFVSYWFRVTELPAVQSHTNVAL